MTQGTTKSSDASLTTKPLGFTELTDSTGGQGIVLFVRRDFLDPDDRAPEVQIDNGTLIRDLVARHERDDVRKAAIVRARAKLAERIQESEDRPSITSLRLQKGLSQTQLGVLIDAKQPYVAKIESGRVENMGAHMIKRLREALGVSADTIIDAIAPGDS